MPVLLALLLASCGARVVSTAQTGDSPSSMSPSQLSRATTVAPTKTPAQTQPRGPLDGAVVGIDPGHNGGNGTHPDVINQAIWNGREAEHCNTTGTQAADGFTEAAFNFAVAKDLTALLHDAGARVVLTRQNNTGVGPCVDVRAGILNSAHVDVGIDIHADGGPTSGRGFAVLEPVADGPNNSVISSSEAFGSDVRAALLRTNMPFSTYDGRNGFIHRDDLAGLNLTSVPLVLIEIGNMRNPTDARLLESPVFRARAAAAFESAIATFLTSGARTARAQ